MSAPNKDYDPVQVSALSEDNVEAAVNAALTDIAAATTLDALKHVRTTHAGPKSPLALANREIGALPPAAKAEAGKRVGMARGRVNQALTARETALESARDDEVLHNERLDVTLPVDRYPSGARHPLSTLQDRVCDLFVGMGYEIVDGPEVEASWFNFDALNTPPDHPSRELQDTLYLDPLDSGMVMRSQTSTVQIRAMLERGVPLYVISPGRVFRSDELDATHSPMFHQVEGLAIDEGLTMAHLRGTLDHFARTMFGADGQTRLRPAYFPFTEPSAEVDLRLPGGGWMEWGGCGMVDPHVLRACGVDPQRYSGFAFGMGLERALMFRNGVPHIRDMFEGDIRFSSQFAMEK